jgi:hypothetical protein
MQGAPMHDPRKIPRTKISLRVLTAVRECGTTRLSRECHESGNIRRQAKASCRPNSANETFFLTGRQAWRAQRSLLLCAQVIPLRVIVARHLAFATLVLSSRQVAVPHKQARKASSSLSRLRSAAQVSSEAQKEVLPCRQVEVCIMIDAVANVSMKNSVGDSTVLFDLWS